jgi:glutamate carboxypeptidase
MTSELDLSKLVAARAFFAQRQNEILKVIRRLVEYESPSGDSDGSSAVNQLLAEMSRTIPAIDSVERITRQGYGEHLLIRAFGKNGKGTTLLLGHTDTVHPVGTVDHSNPIRADGDRFFGPGIFDMKAACVLAVEVLRCLDALSLTPSRPVTLLLTCDEETGSLTVGHW